MREVRGREVEVRRLPPEREALALEAKNLREFGYTQQEIADALRIPRVTITKWLNKMNNGTRGKVNKSAKLFAMSAMPLFTIDIKLHPCRYEDASIPEEAVDLILTDPPYLVSNNDITRSNQASLTRDFGQWDKSPEGSYQTKGREGHPTECRITFCPYFTSNKSQSHSREEANQKRSEAAKEQPRTKDGTRLAEKPQVVEQCVLQPDRHVGKKSKATASKKPIGSEARQCRAYLMPQKDRSERQRR